jgi:cytochrome b561
MKRNTRTNWGSVSRSFHWGLGFVIMGTIAYGWWMNHIPARADRFFHRSIHADIGYVVLLLMVIRLIWRWINPVPALPADTPQWQRIAARVSHGALYGVTISVAMLG